MKLSLLPILLLAAVLCAQDTAQPALNAAEKQFQDALNEYQQDSFSLVDAEDVSRSGQEVAVALPAIGLPNYDQAARILKVNLDRSVRGNTYIEFDSSVKAFGVRPGDLITVTYLKEGNRYLVFASKGGADTNPDWYFNLKAHPDVKIEVGDDTIEVLAEEITGAERDKIYARQSIVSCGSSLSTHRRPKRIIPVIALTPKLRR